jgi:hypothetical protein
VGKKINIGPFGSILRSTAGLILFTSKKDGSP